MNKKLIELIKNKLGKKLELTDLNKLDEYMGVIIESYINSSNLQEYIDEVCTRMEIDRGIISDLLTSTHLYTYTEYGTIQVLSRNNFSFEDLVHDMKLYGEDCYMVISTNCELHTALLNDEDSMYALPKYFYHNYVTSIGKRVVNNREEWSITLSRTRDDRGNGRY